MWDVFANQSEIFDSFATHSLLSLIHTYLNRDLCTTMTIAAEFFHHTDLMVALGFGPLQSSLHIPLVGLFPFLPPCRNWWAIMLKERLLCTYIWFDGQGLFKFTFSKLFSKALSKRWNNLDRAFETIRGNGIFDIL